MDILFMKLKYMKNPKNDLLRTISQVKDKLSEMNVGNFHGQIKEVSLSNFHGLFNQS